MEKKKETKKLKKIPLLHNDKKKIEFDSAEFFMEKEL